MNRPQISTHARSSGVSPQAPLPIRSAKTYEKLWQRWTISKRSLHPHNRSCAQADVEQFYRRVEASGDVVEGRPARAGTRGLRRVSRIDALGAEDPECRFNTPAAGVGANEAQPVFPRRVIRPQDRSLVSHRASSHSPAGAARWRTSCQGHAISRSPPANLPWGSPFPACRINTFSCWFRCLAGLQNPRPCF